MNIKNVIIALLVLIVLVLVARFVVFKQQFDNWGAGVERISEWEKDYRVTHPDATDSEVDAAFKAGISNIQVWKEKYKQDHAGATDADADAAFTAAWDKK